MSAMSEREEVEMPGQLDLLDEIPGETRGTKKCGTGGKGEGNEQADSPR